MSHLLFLLRILKKFHKMFCENSPKIPLIRVGILSRILLRKAAGFTYYLFDQCKQQNDQQDSLELQCCNLWLGYLRIFLFHHWIWKVCPTLQYQMLLNRYLCSKNISPLFHHRQHHMLKSEKIVERGPHFNISLLISVRLWNFKDGGS